MRLKTLSCILLFLCSNIYLSAQQYTTTHILTGRAFDSTSRKPLPYLTMTITPRSGTARPVKTMLGGENGNLRVENLPSGHYLVVLSATGYDDRSISLDISDTSAGQLDMGDLYLVHHFRELKRVEVKANKPLVQQEVDRLIYDVQADPDSRTSNVLDILRKVPLVSVTDEDKIMVKGNGNYRILLNGHPSALIVHKPEEVFKIMQASLIERIEIITIPPAKYEAEGVIAIINIITKKDIGKGYVGGLNASYGPLYSTIDGLLTVKTGKWGISGRLGHFWEDAPQTDFSGYVDNISNSPYLLQQSGNTSYHGTTTVCSMQADDEIDSLNLLTASVSLDWANGTHHTQQTTVFDNAGGALGYSNLLNSTSLSKETSLDCGFNYELTGRRHKDRLFTASYSFNSTPNTQNDSSHTAGLIDYPNLNLLQYNKTGFQEQTFQLDYAYPVGSLNIQAGAKFINRNSYSDYSTGSYDSLDRFESDTANSSSYHYMQDIYGFYNAYLLKAGKWGISAGARLERTVIHADFGVLGLPPLPSYTNLIPTLSMQRKINGFSNWNASYTQRIERPAIWQMNPFVNKSDPAYYFTGNPNLKPVVDQSMSLGYTNFKKGYFNLGLTYTIATHTIQHVTVLGADSISVSTYDNIGSNQTLSTNLNMNLPLTKRLLLTVNGLLTYVWVNGTVNGQAYNNKGIQGNAFSYLSCRLKNNWRASFNAGFFSPTVFLQGTSNGYFYTSYRASKSYFKNKLTIAASVSNPYLRLRVSKNKISTPGFVQEYDYDKIYRTYTIFLTYNFGKLKEQLKKNKNGIKNDDAPEKSENDEKGAQ